MPLSSRVRGARRWTATALVLLLAAPTAAQETGPAPTPATATTPQAPAPRAPDGAPPVVSPARSEPPRPIQGSAGPSVPPPSEAPRSVTVPPPPPDTPAPAPEAHEHLGLFIHGDIGAGYLGTSGSRAGSPFVTQGAALGVAIAIGWAPDDEWAVALEGWVWKALSPSGLGSNTSVELDAIGLNVTRYFVPVEVFATVVVSGTRLAITDDNGEGPEYAHSDIGFGLKVLLGKEWRVSSLFGIGVAAEVFLAVNRTGGESLDTLGGGLLFSFTFR